MYFSRISVAVNLLVLFSVDSFGIEGYSVVCWGELYGFPIVIYFVTKGNGAVEAGVVPSVACTCAALVDKKDNGILVAVC